MAEYPREWEIVEKDNVEATKRMKVHGGWLVLVQAFDDQRFLASQCMHFFKDPDHGWVLK